MKPLEQATLTQRIITTVLIVIVVLLLLSLIGWISGGWDESPAQTLPPSKWDDDIIAIDKQAVKQAYHDQVVHLLHIWAKDETGQPGRAIVGVKQARRMFIEAMTEIEKRERK